MNLKLITLNLRYDKPDRGNNAWIVRKNAIAALINHYKPDIIGTQEGKAHQLLDLHRLLPNYQSVGCDRTGTGTNEHCAIFYHTQRLNCIETGDFFLSNTPEIPGSISSEWGNPLPRMVTWAIFTLTGESKSLTCVNTHLDYKSAKARELGAELIRDRLTPFHPENTYLFLTGDFNADPGTVPRESLSRPLPNGITLNDALVNLKLEDQLSFHDFTGKAFAAVDTIYYDSRISLQDVKVDNSQWQGIWVSDHFAVIAEFLW
ncbi:MAG TPA: endonuclease/exonuclease/phosphatase [Cyanobacteria bacterium UBA12227]|nr:endonuclease/exonuclease/phosphatase [Cyanobacteria bacterium UBA12227]HAX87893.1 endonuclease/exonuclease/phosphatase [Cyanobacteria bacterium UBA11370]HBY76959.1 endonuclease/exonuclease/phosphatase [Cyanobacteria bacterium UBA11148]